MQVSPRLRPAIANPLRPSGGIPRLPARAVVPLLGTCALTAGLGVGILWGASWIGESRSQPTEAPTIAHAPAAAVEATAAERAVQPSIAQALAESEAAYQLVSPPPIALDPLQIAALHADLEAPFTTIATAPATPTRTAAQGYAPAPARPAAADVTGRMAKIAPSDDGLPARVRAKPTTTASIVARVPSGAPLRVLGPADGAKDWLRVTWNGITGYVRADLVR